LRIANGALLSGTLGAVLLGVVVAGRLLGARYVDDVTTLCNAESASAFTVGRNTARVTRWTWEHLKTPEGGRLLASVRDMPPPARAPWLEQRARAAGLPTCPMVRAYEDLARESEARRELQVLCSTTTFPELVMLDEDARLQEVEEWIDVHGATLLTRSLALRLRRARSARERAEALGDAAGDAGLLTCDVAKIIASPVKESCEP
jgi:hypothetical protein